MRTNCREDSENAGHEVAKKENAAVFSWGIKTRNIKMRECINIQRSVYSTCCKGKVK